MLLVSFLLWLCRMFCDPCTITAFATICLTAMGDRQCCHESLWGKVSYRIFRCSSSCFFLYYTVFLFLPVPFLLWNLLATSLAAVSNYIQHWEKGDDTECSTCLCFPHKYSKSCMNIILLLDSFSIYFSLIQTKFFSLSPIWTTL